MSARLTLILSVVALLAGCSQPSPPAAAAPIEIRAVVVTMFEIGEDQGDAAGEFQLWKERQKLTQRIEFAHHHDLFLNPETGVLGMVTGMGSVNSASAVMALALDPRFDLSKAYWLVAGISGVDPEDASIGSAAWAQWLVDGDLAHEIDPREIPADWKTGYFARGTKGPNDTKRPPVDGEVFELNPGLVEWAYQKTKDVDLGDSDQLKATRDKFTGHPNARKPPFVLKGDQLSAMTFWHGTILNDWANQWTRFWTEGKGNFVTSAMEDTGTYSSLNYASRTGKVDKNRVLVLRTASNYTLPPPGVSAAAHLLAENQGYAGLEASVEAAYRVGSVIVHEIATNWDQYKGQIPRRDTVKSLLVRGIHTLVTMDGQRRELRDAAMLVDGNVITRVGTAAELADAVADEVLDLKGRHLVMPGLVNTHHHFYQHLTRALPAAQDASLFDWLRTLYPFWARITPEGIHASAKLCAAELMLSGCTTASDHLYIFPNGATLEDEISGVAEMGLRFHASRGSMSVGQSQGGLPPDSLVESEAAILRDSQRVIESWHDNSRFAMLRVTLAPCSPFSVSRELMRDSALLARNHPGVRLHTHLAENSDDVRYSREHFDMTPAQFAESVGWLGEDVWHAHCVWLDEDGRQRFAHSGTGVAHCPCSNMRLASGLAPLRAMLDAGVPVGLGVDGAASNDASHLLQEARQAMLGARVRETHAGALSARQALELATLGGARVLGRDDIGALAPGMAADFIAIDLERPALAGALHDPVAALLFCHVDRVDYSYINGKRVVEAGHLVAAELPPLTEQVNLLAGRLITA